MSILGSYEVHKSDNDFNKDVIDAIALAKLAKNPRNYIDCLAGGKETKDIRQDKDEERIYKRKEGLEDREEER